MKKTLIKSCTGLIVPFVLLFLLASCNKDEDLPDGPVTDLSVLSVVDNPNPVLGGYVNYVITAKNDGKNTAKDVVVVNSLPEGLVIQTATATQGSYNAQTGLWTIGDLKKNTQQVLTINAKIAWYGDFVNVFKIKGHVTDCDVRNDSTSSTVTPLISGLSKTQKWSCEVFSAMKEIYLWNTSMPSGLNLDKYGSADKTLDYLASLKIDPQTGQPIDRYSFLDEIGNLSGEIDGGTSSGDYGFMVVPAYNSADRTVVSFFVNYVYKNSPAGVAGVARSYEVVKINGNPEVHPAVLPSYYLDTSSAGYINMVNALFYSSSATFTFKKPDGTTMDVSLNTGSYNINSVLCDSIYTAEGKKTGYMVFNMFLGETAQTEIAKTISRFEANGVQNLIVDLRYNGGGSVETCEKFCNLLAPLSANGRVMYSYKMNTGLANYFKSNNVNLTQKFEKTNTFQPARIYFIVGYGTASASELLINNLRPYYPGNLFLIGQTTYGKPCGFWPTPIGYDENQTTPKEGYDLYAVSFESVNANNEGGYYSGMEPGSSKYPGIRASDLMGLRWGDTKDACLQQALMHISFGSFNAAKSASASKVKSLPVQSVLNIDRQFKGMVDFRRHLR